MPERTSKNEGNCRGDRQGVRLCAQPTEGGRVDESGFGDKFRDNHGIANSL